MGELGRWLLSCFVVLPFDSGFYVIKMQHKSNCMLCGEKGVFLVLALILVVSYSSDQSNCWCHLNQNTTLTGTIELFAPKLNCSQDYVINNLFCLNISPTCYSCKCIITLICWPHDGNLDQKCPALIDAIMLWQLAVYYTTEKRTIYSYV